MEVSAGLPNPAEPSRPRSRSLATSVVRVAGALIGITGVIVASGWGSLDDKLRSRFFSAVVERWPRMESIELRIDLRRPSEFSAHARLELADVRERKLPLLLNRTLAPSKVSTVGGAALKWIDGRALRSKYHREARVVWIDLGREPSPSGERVELEFDYGGRAADGSENRDWRGILLVTPDELRMSEQTVFYPQIPLDAAGPGVSRTRGALEVLAPKDFEVFVPGRAVAGTVQPGPDARAWRFELDEPSVLCVLGGRRVRHEVEQEGVRVVTLLREERAELGAKLIEDARAALRFFSARFGPIAGQVFGIVEIQGRGASYNWAQQGVAAFESGAFDDRGLPAEKLGHELAHLWWGQAVAASGEGERFLTEGMAEYASWRWVEELRGIDEARSLARKAREDYMREVHEIGRDPALARVDFSTPGYVALAYRKGALALRAAEHGLGREGFDTGLRRYVESSRGSGGTIDGLMIALYGSSERGGSELPWIHRDGHAHLKLVDLSRDEADPWTRGTVVLDACPKGIEPLVAKLIDLRFAKGPQGTLSCSFDSDGRAPFAIQTLADAIVLDSGVHALATGDMVHSFRALTLVRSDPAQGARDVPYLKDRIELEFDRALAPLPAEARSHLRGAMIEGAKARGAIWPAIGEPSLEKQGRLLVLALSQALEPGREIAVVIDGALEDTDGIPVAGIALTFHTVAASDAYRPVVIATTPEAGSTEVDCSLDEIRIEFSEPMRSGRGYSGTEVHELGQRGWKFPLQPGKHDAHWTRGGRVLVYELSAPLEPGSRYMLPMRGAFRDLAGNDLVDFEYRFETRP